MPSGAAHGQEPQLSPPPCKGKASPLRHAVRCGGEHSLSVGGTARNPGSFRAWILGRSGDAVYLQWSSHTGMEPWWRAAAQQGHQAGTRPRGGDRGQGTINEVEEHPPPRQERRALLEVRLRCIGAHQPSAHTCPQPPPPSYHPSPLLLLQPYKAIKITTNKNLGVFKKLYACLSVRSWWALGFRLCKALPWVQRCGGS